MGIKFTNNAEGTLTAGIDNSATVNLTLTAGDGLLFPTIVLASGNYFYATLVDSSGNREIIQVTEHQDGTDVFQTIVRGEDDTSGIAFAIGDKVQLRLPKVILEEFRDDITTNASDLTDYETSNDIALAASNARLTEIELYQVLAAPTGITLYIYNPAGEIPTGWSAKSGPADCLLAIAGGSDAYDVAGENTAGSWTPTGHVHTGPSHIHTMPTHYHTIAHTHTTGSLALTLAQMPPHTHVYYRSSGNMNHSSGSGALYQEYATNSGAAGSGAIHNHGTTSGASGGNSGSTDPGDTAGSGTANTGSSKEPSTDRPFAAVGILIERD